MGNIATDLFRKKLQHMSSQKSFRINDSRPDYAIDGSQLVCVPYDGFAKLVYAHQMHFYGDDPHWIWYRPMYNSILHITQVGQNWE
jgi:hypothetical protein